MADMDYMDLRVGVGMGVVVVVGSGVGALLSLLYRYQTTAIQ